MFPPKKPAAPKKPPMGIGSPPPISGKMPEPDADDTGGPPDNDADDQQGKLTPETMGYHADAQNCGNCSHNEGGTCDVGGQPVTDEGGCKVWESGGADTAMDMAPEPAAAAGRPPYGS